MTLSDLLLKITNWQYCIYITCVKTLSVTLYLYYLCEDIICHIVLILPVWRHYLSHCTILPVWRHYLSHCTILPVWRHYYLSHCTLLHTHIDILNLISLKNVTWHSTFRYINSWTLCHMVISTARDVISTVRDNCIISPDDFILHCDIKHRHTEYESSLSICCQIWTRPHNYGTV